MNPHDFLEIDRQLSDEDRLIKETVSRYVNERYLPGVAEHFENGTFDRSVPEDLGELNVLGMHLTGYGCAGASAVAYGVACRSSSPATAACVPSCSVQGSLAMFAIWKCGSEEQKQRWLPGMAAGEADRLLRPDRAGLRLGPGRDADHAPAATATTGSSTAPRCGSPTGTIADVAVVWARTDDGVQGFLVEPGMPGFTAPEMHGKLSLRASVTSELIFDEVRLPGCQPCCPEVQSLRGPLSCLNEARYGIVWGVVGAARCLLRSGARLLADPASSSAGRSPPSS